MNGSKILLRSIAQGGCGRHCRAISISLQCPNLQQPLSKAYIERINEGDKSTKQGLLRKSVYAIESNAVQLEPEDASSTLKRVVTYPELSTSPFSQKACKILNAPVQSEDIELKGDGLIYLPEIKYRRILTAAFGCGGWALVPTNAGSYYKSEVDSSVLVTREFALFCEGRFVSQAVGEHIMYGSIIPNLGKALESAKSNALTRCCKDLCIASELWDRKFINRWLKMYAVQVWCTHAKTKDKKRFWRRKDSSPIDMYPWKESP